MVIYAKTEKHLIYLYNINTFPSKQVMRIKKFIIVTFKYRFSLYSPYWNFGSETVKTVFASLETRSNLGRVASRSCLWGILVPRSSVSFGHVLVSGAKKKNEEPWGRGCLWGQMLVHAQRRKFWSPTRQFPAQSEIEPLIAICEKKQK